MDPLFGVAVTLLWKLRDESASFTENSVCSFLRECLGPRNEKELQWITDSLQTTMEFYKEVESRRRYLRLPITLAESSFVTDLRRGSALRSLRRIFVLGRVQRIVEDCLDDILAGK